MPQINRDAAEPPLEVGEKFSFTEDLLEAAIRTQRPPVIVFCRSPESGGIDFARRFGHALSQRFGGLRRSAWSGDAFVEAFRDAVQTKRVSEFRSFQRGELIFSLDHLEELLTSPAAQEELAATLDAIEHAGGCCVLSTGLDVSEWGRFTPRLRSRLQAGLVVPADELAKKKAENAGGEESFRNLAGEPISPRKQGTSFRPPLEVIARRAAELWGLRPAELRGPCRHRALTTARQVAMYLARAAFGYSLRQIGSFFGGRDHATVAHACKRVSELVKRDDQLRLVLDALRQGIASTAGTTGEIRHGRARRLPKAGQKRRHKSPTDA
jgi:chromosomal replication initiation ATPase DnaA